MMRIGEAVFFITLAAGAHLGLWAVAPATSGATSAGGSGEDRITLSAATAAQAAMIEAWQRPPEVAPAPQLPAADAPPAHDASPVVLPQPAAQLPRAVLQARALPMPQVPDLPDLDSEPPPPVARNDGIAEVRPKSRPLRTPLPRAAEASEDRQRQRAEGSAQGQQRAADGDSKLTSQTTARTNALRAEWGSAIYAQVRRTMRFPRGVDQGGTAKLALRIASNGTLTDLRLTRSSGNDALDKAAMRAVSQAGRFARAPQGLPGAEHDFSLSLTFAP